MKVKMKHMTARMMVMPARMLVMTTRMRLGYCSTVYGVPSGGGPTLSCHKPEPFLRHAFLGSL